MAKKPFATGTKTSISTTEEQIKTMLRKAGAEKVGTMEEPGQVFIAFVLHDRSIRFRVPLPRRDEDRFTTKATGSPYGTRAPRGATVGDGLWVQACRERYRQLHLCIKAKLESVEQGIELFDDAFLSQIVTPDGQTFGDKLRPQMKELMDGKPLPPLLTNG